MPNGGRYQIGEQLGEGGLSLIYAGKTAGNGYPVTIKEFFPSEHARRAEVGQGGEDRVCPDPGYEDRFARCLQAFEQEGQLGSAAHRQNFQILSFSDCGAGYAILPRWSDDSCSLLDLADGWLDQAPPSPDPVFTDLGRVTFALQVISSLLSALEAVHNQGMLHLDITPTNVVWAGQSRTSPKNGAALLADFGCSVLMTDGAYPAEYVLSYSRGYAAPEYDHAGGFLNESTDLYSVGRLLIFLLRGDRAFYKHTSLERELAQLNIPGRLQKSLLDLAETAANPQMGLRYQSAEEMQGAVTEILEQLPAHPINTDNTAAFTLSSLKSMLEGSLDTRYSWARELCDRRDVSIDLPEAVLLPLSALPEGKFRSDRAFLEALLPDTALSYLEAQGEGWEERILSGNYPEAWRGELARQLSGYTMQWLLSKCRGLRPNQGALRADLEVLQQLPGPDMDYFKQCYLTCLPVIAGEPAKALALLTLFALLGQGDRGFSAFCGHSPSAICRLLSD